MPMQVFVALIDAECRGKSWLRCLLITVHPITFWAVPSDTPEFEVMSSPRTQHHFY